MVGIDVAVTGALLASLGGLIYSGYSYDEKVDFSVFFSLSMLSFVLDPVFSGSLVAKGSSAQQRLISAFMKSLLRIGGVLAQRRNVFTVKRIVVLVSARAYCR